jgi:predicted nucleic acid-binding protein
MELVIDTSALLAVLLDEPERPVLINVTRNATLFTPPSVPWEIGNAVTALLKRRRINKTQALAIVRAFENIPLRGVTVDLERAVEIAAELGLYAYDAYLLEAARKLDCPLLTLDRALSRAAATLGVRTREALV